MTFKSWFLILCVLQIKYFVFCTYWAYKFRVEILKVMDSDFDLQMTFKLRFLILRIVQIKYLVFLIPIGLRNFGCFVWGLHLRMSLRSNCSKNKLLQYIHILLAFWTRNSMAILSRSPWPSNDLQIIISYTMR